MDYLQEELLGLNFISAICGFISLINITLLLFYTFFASHGFYVVNRVEYNDEGVEDQVDEDNSDTREKLNNDENLMSVKESRNSQQE